MVRQSRPLAFVVLAAALFAAGCGKSNNEGKIVGKWKFTQLPAGQPGADELKMLDSMGMYIFFEFKNDNAFEMGVGSNDAKMLELIKGKAGQTSFSAKYKLLSGDGIEMYDLPKEMQEKGGVFGKNKDRARTKVTINGDEMTMTDDDGKTAKFTRVSAAPPGAPGEVPGGKTTN